MTEQYVIEALQKTVASASGAGQVPVKSLNRNMKPPQGNKWWEVVYIPNNPVGETWGKEKTFTGILRLVLHWPQNNEGISPALQEIDRMAQFFQKGSKHQDTDENVTVSIVDNPDVGSPIEESPENLIPLTIRYSYFRI